MRSRWIARLAAGAGLLAAAGCGGERVSLNDRGEACLSSDGVWPTSTQTFELGAPVHVTILFHSCLSSTCDVDREAECTVERDGFEVFIDGRASYTDERGPGVSCTEDCGRLEASCSTDVLTADGTYTFYYANRRLELMIPSMSGAYCIDTHD